MPVWETKLKWKLNILLLGVFVPFGQALLSYSRRLISSYQTFSSTKLNKAHPKDHYHAIKNADSENYCKYLNTYKYKVD